MKSMCKAEVASIFARGPDRVIVCIKKKIFAQTKYYTL
jgi:hypothetical protein